ncbi:MAG: phage head closure protein [Elusimicrobia bacterium]|nr:phage head closure protein [Elusimicrobiota bacterium]
MYRTPGRGAGYYNVPGTIQQNQPKDTTQGQLVPNWVNLYNDWFHVTGKAGPDARKFEQLHPTVTHIVHVRFSSNSSGIVPTRFRIVLNDGSGQILNIQSVFDVDKRRTEVELQCVEVKL